MLNKFVCLACKETKLTHEPIEEKKICKNCHAKGITVEMAETETKVEKEQVAKGIKLQGSKKTFEVG